MPCGQNKIKIFFKKEHHPPTQLNSTQVLAHAWRQLKPLTPKGHKEIELVSVSGPREGIWVNHTTWICTLGAQPSVPEDGHTPWQGTTLSQTKEGAFLEIGSSEEEGGGCGSPSVPSLTFPRLNHLQGERKVQVPPVITTFPLCARNSTII